MRILKLSQKVVEYEILSVLIKCMVKGKWRKLKGIATLKLRNGKIKIVELHWYEAHGIGKKEIKRKRYL